MKQLAKQLAAKYHKDQSWGPYPYVEHLDRVDIESAKWANKLYFVSNELTSVVAILHDSIEDTSITHTEIIDNFGDFTYRLILSLTDISGYSRNESHAITYPIAAAHPISSIVKIADRKVNTNLCIATNNERKGIRYVEEHKEFERIFGTCAQMLDLNKNIETLRKKWF